MESTGLLYAGFFVSQMFIVLCFLYLFCIVTGREIGRN